MKKLEKIWKNWSASKQLPDLYPGWSHGLLQIGEEIRHGAFTNVYHLYPGDGYTTEPLWVFSDETISVQLQWGERCHTLQRFRELLADQTIVAFPPENSRIVEIARFVYEVVNVDSKVGSDDLVLEIQDVWKRLRNESDSLDLCRSAVRKYSENPNDDNLLKLRESYFSIPCHRRVFLIGMDAKDHLVKSLLGAEDKELVELLTLQLKQEINYSWKNNTD